MCDVSSRKITAAVALNAAKLRRECTDKVSPIDAQPPDETRLSFASVVDRCATSADPTDPVPGIMACVHSEMLRLAARAVSTVRPRACSALGRILDAAAACPPERSRGCLDPAAARFYSADVQPYLICTVPRDQPARDTSLDLVCPAGPVSAGADVRVAIKLVSTAGVAVGATSNDLAYGPALRFAGVQAGSACRDAPKRGGVLCNRDPAPGVALRCVCSSVSDPTAPIPDGTIAEITLRVESCPASGVLVITNNPSAATATFPAEPVRPASGAACALPCT
jgi:hypothetical protein